MNNKNKSKEYVQKLYKVIAALGDPIQHDGDGLDLQVKMPGIPEASDPGACCHLIYTHEAYNIVGPDSDGYYHWQDRVVGVFTQCDYCTREECGQFFDDHQHWNTGYDQSDVPWDWTPENRPYPEGQTENRAYKVVFTPRERCGHLIPDGRPKGNCDSKFDLTLPDGPASQAPKSQGDQLKLPSKAPTGACCSKNLYDDTCYDGWTEDQCNNSPGPGHYRWKGEGSTCDTAGCQSPYPNK